MLESLSLALCLYSSVSILLVHRYLKYPVMVCVCSAQGVALLKGVMIKFVLESDRTGRDTSGDNFSELSCRNDEEKRG